MRAIATDDAGGWELARPVSGAGMIGFRDLGSTGMDIRVVAMPAVTVVIEFGGNDLLVDSSFGRQALGGFATCYAKGTMRVQGAGVECVEMRLSPLRAYSLTGLASADLGGAVVDLTDLWGRPVERLRERLADAVTWEERFALTKSFVAQCDGPVRTPDPEVVGSWNRVVASRGQITVGALAESCGWSRKRLWSRFESQVGLTPKRAAMLVRFRNAVEGLLTGRPAADVAAGCGYADQSHLCRDVASFADITPGAVAGELVTALSKMRHRAWGTFFQYGAAAAAR